jgi:hypothetical protein
MSKSFNTHNAGSTPYNPIIIDDASSNEASHAQVRRYLSGAVLENMEDWIRSVQSSSTPVYNPDNWPQYPPSEEYLNAEPSTLSVDMEHEVPLMLPAGIDQQRVKETLYRLMADAPPEDAPSAVYSADDDTLLDALSNAPSDDADPITTNDNIIAICGKRRLCIYIKGKYQGRKCQYRVLRYPVNVYDPDLKVTAANSEWITRCDLLHNKYIMTTTKKYCTIHTQLGALLQNKILIIRHFPAKNILIPDGLFDQYWYEEEWARSIPQ